MTARSPQLFDQESRPGPGPVRMDPRIRQRRLEVRREEGRRRRRALLVCLAVAVTLAGAAGATRSPLLDVDYVDVRGAEQTPRLEVLRAGGLDGHPAMVEVDSGSVARKVEALPWVRDATVRRDWPGTVRIDLTERRPAAVLPAGQGEWAVADAAGRVLAVGADKPAALPVIGGVPQPGPPGSSLGRDVRPALEVAASLPPALQPRVADVASVAGGQVELQLVPPGGVVRLGPPSGLAEKLRVLQALLEQADLARLAVIDVRVPTAPALTRR
ncbi:MAG: cell division protein FtsQ/DivIB [Acidimicrobiales bacterium]